MSGYFLQNKHLAAQLLVGGLARDEHLPGQRLAATGHLADLGAVDGHVAPAHHLQAALLGQPGEVLLALGAAGGVREADPRGVAAEGRQLHVLRRPELSRVQVVGDSGEHARAIAGVVVARTGATVVHAHGQLLRIAEDLVRALAIDGDDEANATGRLLIVGVVEAVRGRQRPGLVGHQDRVAVFPCRTVLRGWAAQRSSGRELSP